MDIESLAEKAVETLAVAPGQVIWIWASSHSLDFIEALAYHIRARGAFWSIRLIIEPLLQRIGKEVSQEYLGLIPEHELHFLRDVNAIIEVRDHGGYIPGVEISRRRAMASEWIALLDEADRLECRHFTVINPTQALADAYAVPLVLLRQRYFQAMGVDNEILDALQEHVAALLTTANQIHLTTPLGTDLILSITGRPIHQDHSGLPYGEVYVAPLEYSAVGVAVIDRAFIRGKVIEKLSLTFEGGRVVQIDAPDAEATQPLEELLAVSTGDKDRIAELGIGLNPGVKDLTGDIMLDEKLSGSVHIAIGMNNHFGGQNHSNLHLDLVMLHPSILADGKPLSLEG